MGITDKARRARALAQSQKDTQSTTLVVVNPTTKRVRAVITNLSDFVMKAGDGHQKNMSRLMGMVIDEAIEELGERDERQMQRWMIFMARILEWSGTGNVGILPQELVPFIADVEGIPVEEAQRQWEEANDVSNSQAPRGDDVEHDDESGIIEAEIVEEIG
jgi:hypothetical protein